ncbi:RNA polymerase sigma factor [Paraconexibacter antarcticus]|uniref:RNA polymerase sigma factor n=1 Tax=Paraconexibacter antarcticus TaxID=2949664 RepID=A0ABY5DT92_9ACTN|nr:RNA polymerase sigma factor [Paraconexibacter antarcticus]UTI63900.1 RNA polymerase sigma factor [Paraconexibacter antarcticus]
MQPRSEPPPAHGDEAALFHQHHRDLHRAIARRVNGSTQLVEDACQFAWMRLIDCQPDRDKIFGWLYVVALHEAYRLSGIERRDAHLDRLPSREGDWITLMTDPRTIDLVLDAREALRALAALPERQRRDFALHVGGRSYREIAAATRRTYTNVDKTLDRARAQVKLERLCATQTTRGPERPPNPLRHAMRNSATT